jgi:hypothetical protein
MKDVAISLEIDVEVNESHATCYLCLLPGILLS